MGLLLQGIFDIRNLYITNDFLYPSNGRRWEKNLVVASTFCQALGASLYRGSTVLLLAASMSLILQPTVSKTDTFGTSTKCPCKSDDRVIQSRIKGVKKGRDQV